MVYEVALAVTVSLHLGIWLPAVVVLEMVAWVRVVGKCSSWPLRGVREPH